MGPLIVIAIILLIILIAIISNVKIVPQAHAYVVERLGAYHSTWGTGLHVNSFYRQSFKKSIFKRAGS